MLVKEKMLLNREGLTEHGPVNIVIFGDSVSHGAVNDYIDYENVYWNQLKKRMNKFRDYMPVNMINASIGGTTAKESVKRIDKQVLNHCPDLVIVCFGLNDVNGSLEDYLDSLKEIFQRCLDYGTDVIFMTPNMLNTSVADDVKPTLRDYAVITAGFQNDGVMDTYIYSAVDLAKQMNVTVCDCYSKWKELSKSEDVTMLLANRINHPEPHMQKLFVDSLYEIIMGDEASGVQGDSTMFKG